MFATLREASLAIKKKSKHTIKNCACTCQINNEFMYQIFYDMCYNFHMISVNRTSQKKKGLIYTIRGSIIEAL